MECVQTITEIGENRRDRQREQEGKGKRFCEINGKPFYLFNSEALSGLLSVFVHGVVKKQMQLTTLLLSYIKTTRVLNVFI